MYVSDSKTKVQMKKYLDLRLQTILTSKRLQCTSNKYAQHGKIYMSSPMYAENSKFSMMRVK